MILSSRQGYVVELKLPWRKCTFVAVRQKESSHCVEHFTHLIVGQGRLAESTRHWAEQQLHQQ